MIKILAASLGILAVSWLPTLPGLPQSGGLAALLLAGAVAVILLLLSRSLSRSLGCFCLGALWGIIAGHQLIASQLPASLEGEDLLVKGFVSELPENRGEFQRFEFTVGSYRNVDPAYLAKQPLPDRILLSWYGQNALRVGQRWTLRVSLKRPRGFVNAGGFDYQRWLLSRGLGATGYVRSSSHNYLHGVADGLLVNKQRQRIRDWINARFEPEIGALLLALAIGDSSAISPAQWGLLRETGTSHLMAISGLHIGLIALFGYWLGHGLRSAVSLPGRPLSLGYLLPGCISCLLAAGYAAMADFALPTQRALTMVLLVNIALLASRAGSSVRALAWAMLVVLLMDPLAGYELGFWLSFGAVGVLLFYFQHRYHADETGTLSGLRGIAGFGRAQWAIFVGLMVPLLVLNQPLSLLTPVANLLAIPMVSFLVVAPLLSGLLLQGLGAGLGGGLVQVAATMLGWCISMLAWLNDYLQTAAWYPQGAGVKPLAVVAAMAGVLLLLSPRGIPARWLGALLLVPLLLPSAIERAPLTVTALDVGQGLAIVVTTRNRVLVYDTGPAYSERFNAGDAIIAPYLRARGLHRLDRLVVSHGDGDHAGGLDTLLSSVAVADVVAGDRLPALESYPALPVSACDQDTSWRWDSVSFRFIEPGLSADANRNNRSCILLIEYRDQRVLIPGDIEAPVEKSLLAREQLPPGVTLLIAPHHGSATSSTPGFVERVRAQHILYSAAYRSPYGHPHPQVRARYQAVGSQAHNTAEMGQVSFEWDRAGRLNVEARRETNRRYWFDGL